MPGESFHTKKRFRFPGTEVLITMVLIAACIAWVFAEFRSRFRNPDSSATTTLEARLSAVPVEHASCILARMRAENKDDVLWATAPVERTKGFQRAERYCKGTEAREQFDAELAALQAKLLSTGLAPMPVPNSP